MTNDQKRNDVIEGAVRIGGGAKLHPAHMEPRADGRYSLWIRCACPGTSQGSAYNRAKFIPGATRTCSV